jgi:hypothetical protein
MAEAMPSIGNAFKTFAALRMLKDCLRTDIPAFGY